MENKLTLIQSKQELLKPIASPAQVIAFTSEVHQLIVQALQKDVDYGVIPGTRMPTLLKPGAEKLCVSFGMSPHFEVISSDIDHNMAVKYSKKKSVWINGRKEWKNEEGESIGKYVYEIKCTLKDKSGREVASALASCSSFENKYVDRPRECQNTIIKMAQKRAFVAVVLNALSLSGRFSQDLEDIPEFVLDKKVPKKNPAPQHAPTPYQEQKPVYPQHAPTLYQEQKPVYKVGEAKETIIVDTTRKKEEPKEIFSMKSTDHQDRIAKILLKKNIDSVHWENIGFSLDGKEITTANLEAAINQHVLSAS